MKYIHGYYIIDMIYEPKIVLNIYLFYYQPDDEFISFYNYNLWGDKLERHYKSLKNIQIGYKSTE